MSYSPKRNRERKLSRRFFDHTVNEVFGPYKTSGAACGASSRPGGVDISSWRPTARITCNETACRQPQTSWSGSPRLPEFINWAWLLADIRQAYITLIDSACEMMSAPETWNNRSKPHCHSTAKISDTPMFSGIAPARDWPALAHPP